MPKHFYSSQQENDILSLYNDNIGSNTIAKKYGVTQKVVKRILSKHGVVLRYPTKFKTFNESYFDIIDTEDKAYFLGLLFADGCVLDGGSRKKRLSISLQEPDRDILEAMIRYTNYSGTIDVKSRLRKAHHKRECVLFYSSDHMCESLMRLGCTPRKSFTLEFPTGVPESLIRHFIRGLFDGDGSIHGSKSGGLNYEAMSFDIYGTRSICNGVKQTFTDSIGVSGSRILKRGSIFAFLVGGNKNIRKIYEYLYKDATIFMERKRARMYRAYDYPNSTTQLIAPKLTLETNLDSI